ncbi:MAG: ZIP family metal transporter [Gaiellaceae bacterium]
MDEPGALAVLAAALVTALATGLGAAPFLFVAHLARSWVGVANALAAGFMIAASGLLFYEGARDGFLRMAGGAVVGVLFVAWAARRLAGRQNVHFAALGGADARKALLLVGVMTVHSVAEGIGVGVSFGGGGELGLVTAIAIAIHNIPEGLAISLVLIPRGVRVMHAAGWSVFSSLPQPLVAVPAFLFVALFAGLVPFGLGFAGGAMLWMVAAQVVPDALATSSRRLVALALAGSTAAMIALQALLLT